MSLKYRWSPWRSPYIPSMTDTFLLLSRTTRHSALFTLVTFYLDLKVTWPFTHWRSIQGPSNIYFKSKFFAGWMIYKKGLCIKFTYMRSTRLLNFTFHLLWQVWCRRWAPSWGRTRANPTCTWPRCTHSSWTQAKCSGRGCVSPSCWGCNDPSTPPRR